MKCVMEDCEELAGNRRVVLLAPDGSDDGPCGPRCEPHTDELLGRLWPTYAGGRPAYRIDHEGAQHA